MWSSFAQLDPFPKHLSKLCCSLQLDTHETVQNKIIIKVSGSNQSERLAGHFGKLWVKFDILVFLEKSI